MTELALGQRSYLLDLLIKAFPNANSEHLWDITGLISEKQYKLMIALYFQDREKLSEIVTNLLIKFQFK